MADQPTVAREGDTIYLDPTSHALQVVRPPDVIPQYPRNPDAKPAPLPVQTIVLAPHQQGDAVEKATWSTSFVNDLPDGSFLYVESGDKDGEGKTTPRSKRHFPYKDASGKVDLPHLRNAIARIPQSNAPGLTPEKKRSLQERARRMLENANKDMGEMGMMNEAPMGYSPLYGVTSFAELDDLEQAEEAGYHAKELTGQFQMMIGNIMADPTIDNKGAAINRLTSEFTMRLKQPMKKEKSGLLESIRNLFSRPPAADPLPMATEKDKRFMVWKDAATGQYRWFAIYSNQFRDEDHPPEIISEKSHKSFLHLVDTGTVDYPELWHWHTPGTAWGKADWLDYADGFAVASGYVYPGHEKEAEAVSNLDDIRVSHGMPSRFIVRNKQDPTIIDFHVTTEISDLPGFAAANPLTEFAVLNGKESDMAFTPEKRQYLVQAGLSEAAIKELEGSLANKAQAAADAGLERKETSEAPVASPPATDAPAYPTMAEVAAAFADVVKPLSEALSAITARLDTVDAQVKALAESDEAKIAKAAAATPRASLQELIASSILGNPAAVVDGRTALAKAGPKQAPAEPNITPSPFLDALMQHSRGGVQ